MTYTLDVQTTQGRVTGEATFSSLQEAQTEAKDVMATLALANIPAWIDIRDDTGVVETVGPPPVVTG